VVGAAIGVFATYQYQNFINRIFLSATAAEEVDAMVRALRKLRESRTDGVMERLEERLDDALLRLGASYETGPRIVPTALEAARTYRVEFPRKTSSEFIDATVAKTLSLNSEQKR
jgi:hypothetical protein